MANLYDLTKEFLDVAARLDEMEIDDETMADTLESLQIPIEQKIENIVKFIRNLETLADARKLEAKRLSDLATKDLKKAERLMDYVDGTMKMLNKTKLTAGPFQLSYTKGREIVDVNMNEIPFWADMPEIYVHPAPELMNKTKLKEILKSGIEIPGVRIVRNPDKLGVK